MRRNGAVRKVGLRRSAATTTADPSWRLAAPTRRTGGARTEWGRKGLLLAAKPHRPMPLSMTTDPRGPSTRPGARSGSGAGEREWERAGARRAQECGGAEVGG